MHHIQCLPSCCVLYCRTIDLMHRQYYLYSEMNDFSGMETSGNKARKLEFLFADALEKKADCIVTCGGVQSNHCRATAAAARMLNMDSYLLLRSQYPDDDPGLVGNLLVDKLVGSKLILMSRQEYGKYGSDAMIERTCERLRSEGRNPYPIPVGGSNGLGTWGYVDAVEEIHKQFTDIDLDISDVAFACGSGGSAAGLGVGFYLYSKAFPRNVNVNFENYEKPPVHAYIVCDKPKYFYDYIDQRILPELGLDNSSDISTKKFLQITNAQGTGYARSTLEELEFITSVARTTGVVLDPVYSGKALFHLIKDLQQNQAKFLGNNILFVHTGGLLGLYDKVDDIDAAGLVNDQVQRFKMLMSVYSSKKETEN